MRAMRLKKHGEPFLVSNSYRVGICLLSATPREFEAHRQHETKVCCGGGQAFGSPV